ncbi:methyltransferase family protein [Stackebrandtia endophytica]|uniref:Methyltransferase family protein n=1 Tax=Stackebrandtia endophytica TaxID=1496996 RepID=A0A543B1C4_9ACTN|nr:class I SAM-dependent methyltransferase [Stackebrandtia endophytica]TQL78632.1 methyltransferase family protein [Stackebrandtia endophytica]
MLMDSVDVDRLREALVGADYTSAGVTARLGQRAEAAMRRGDHRAALAATDDRDRQATLIRLFCCGQTESIDSVAAAVAPLPVRTAVECGLLTEAEDGIRAGWALAAHQGRWLLSDLPAWLGGTVDSEHVLGVAGASESLAGYLMRRPVETALDIGTGSGPLALQLSGQATTVTATDLSSRALRFAATNAALNRLDWELLEGDLVEPVAGRRFDQVVSNPPFITGPGATDFTYRDSGRAGDGVCAELAQAAPGLLNPGGTMQFLANWLHVEGQPWTERVAGWFTDSGCDVWVIQRDVADPLDYVRIWQRDAGGDHDPTALAAWLDWFEMQRVEAVGFGVVNIRLRESGDATVVCEDLRQQPAVAFDTLITDWFDRVDMLADLSMEELLDARLSVRPGVKLDQRAELTDEGWDVERQILSDTAGLGRREEIDPLLVSFLGGCSGLVPMRTQIGLLAQAHEAPEALLAAGLLPVVTGLIRRGFLDVRR